MLIVFLIYFTTIFILYCHLLLYSVSLFVYTFIWTVHSSPEILSTRHVCAQWSFAGITGLRVLHHITEVESCIQAVIRPLFELDTFAPKLPLFWSDLFSQRLSPTDENASVSWLDGVGHSAGKSYAYAFSSRAQVNLKQWEKVSSRQQVLRQSRLRSRIPIIPEEVVFGVVALESLVTQVLLPQAGFNPNEFQFEVDIISILLQTPFGGKAQVAHTDDPVTSELGQYVSLLFPCHTQASTVWIEEIHPNALGGLRGIKPRLSLGSYAMWSKVKHFGSSCQEVPHTNVLRSSVFVGVKVMSKTQKLTAVVSNANDFSVQSDNEIHFEPETHLWTGGLVPVVRVCCSCSHAIHPCYPREFSQNEADGKLVSTVMYCVQCCKEKPDLEIENHVICQWCERNPGFERFQSYEVNSNCKFPSWTEHDTVLDFVYSGLSSGCVHGARHFRPLPLFEHLHLVFTREEVRSACSFWAQYLRSYGVVVEHAPRDLFNSTTKTKDLWSVFMDLFLSNKRCKRARRLCWFGSLIAGFGPVFQATTTKLFQFGNVPLFANNQQQLLDKSLSVYVEALSCVDRGASGDLRSNTHNDKNVKRLYRFLVNGLYDESVRCSCSNWNESDLAQNPDLVHQVQCCPGPVLVHGVACEGPVEATPDHFQQAGKFMAQFRQQVRVD